MIHNARGQPTPIDHVEVDGLDCCIQPSRCRTIAISFIGLLRMMICTPICIAVCMVVGWISVLVILPVVVLVDLCCYTRVRVSRSTGVRHFFESMARGLLLLLVSPFQAFCMFLGSCVTWCGSEDPDPILHDDDKILRYRWDDDSISGSPCVRNYSLRKSQLHGCLRRHVFAEVILLQSFFHRTYHFLQRSRSSRVYVHAPDLWSYRIRPDFADEDEKTRQRRLQQSAQQAVQEVMMVEWEHPRPMAYPALAVYRPLASVQRLLEDPCVAHPDTVCFAEARYAAREMDQRIYQPQMQQYEKEVYEAIMLDLVMMPAELCRLIASFTASISASADVLTISESVGSPILGLAGQPTYAVTQSNTMDAKLYALVLQGYRVKEISAWSNAALTVQLTFAPPDVLQLPADRPLTPEQAAACFTTPLYQPAGYAFKYPDDAHFWTEARFTAGGVRSTLRLEPGEFITAMKCNPCVDGWLAELEFHTSASHLFVVVSGVPPYVPPSAPPGYDGALPWFESLTEPTVIGDPQSDVRELVGLYRTLTCENDVISTRSIGAIFIDREYIEIAEEKRWEEFALHEPVQSNMNELDRIDCGAR
jgi:hypothetical protein